MDTTPIMMFAATQKIKFAGQLWTMDQMYTLRSLASDDNLAAVDAAIDQHIESVRHLFEADQA